MTRLYYLAKAIISDTNNLPKPQTGQAQVDSIVKAVLGICGAIAVIFIVLGAIRYGTSQGDPSATRQAKETIIYALVGLVVVVMAFGLVQFVLNKAFQ